METKELKTEDRRLWVDGKNQLPEEVKRHFQYMFGEGNYLVVDMNGDAMDDGTSRSISDGDGLLLKQYTGDAGAMPYETRLIALCTNNGNFVNQVTHVDEATGDVTCHSFNSQYDDFVVPAEDIIQLFTVERILYSEIII